MEPQCSANVYYVLSQLVGGSSSLRRLAVLIAVVLLPVSVAAPNGANADHTGAQAEQARARDTGRPRSR